MNTYTFGNCDPYGAQCLEVIDGQTRASDLIVPRVLIIEDEYLGALEDLDRNWQRCHILEDPQTGKRFEFALTNSQVGAEEGIDIELSTYTSSISGNIGNAIEFAEHSVLYPDRQRLYIASFGNGGSDYWDKGEERYIKKTGRFTQPNGEPLPTIAALARALQLGGYVVTRASANSAGGAYATALMGALPEGQVTHAYIKSRPNISNHPMRLLWGLGMIKGDMKDDKLYKQDSKDAWKLDDRLLDQARLVMKHVYLSDTGGAWEATRALSDRGVSHLWSDMMAFSRGPEASGVGPASIDTLYALQNQPEALLTYHTPQKDRLYKKIGDVIRFMEEVDYLNNSGADTRVQSLVMPGTHRDHTQYPSLRWAFERHAFGRQR